MSMILAALKPGTEGYRSHQESEGEFMAAQRDRTKPLLAGALAILKTNEATCNACSSAGDLLELHDEAMKAASAALAKTKRPRRPVITVEQLLELLGENGRADVDILIDARGRLYEGHYRLKIGTGAYAFELSEDEKAG